MASKKNPTSIPRIVADLESKVASFDKQLSGSPGGLRDDIKSLKEGVDAVRLEQAESRGQKRLLQILVGVAVAALVGQYFNRNPNSQAITDLGKQITELSVLSKGQAERVLRLEGYHHKANLETPLPDGREAMEAALLDKIQAVEHAQAQGIAIPPEVIAASAKNIISATESVPELAQFSWRGLSSLVDYRSHLNLSLPLLTMPGGFSTANVSEWHMEIEGRHPQAGSGFSVSRRMVPASEGARWEQLGITANQKQSDRPAQLVVTGPIELKLDGKWLKNVVIRNSTIFYAGDAVRLENVVFVDCKFKFERSERAERVFLATLDSTSTTVDIS